MATRKIKNVLHVKNNQHFVDPEFDALYEHFLKLEARLIDFRSHLNGILQTIRGMCEHGILLSGDMQAFWNIKLADEKEPGNFKKATAKYCMESDQQMNRNLRNMLENDLKSKVLEPIGQLLTTFGFIKSRAKERLKLFEIYMHYKDKVRRIEEKTKSSYTEKRDESTKLGRNERKLREARSQFEQGHDKLRNELQRLAESKYELLTHIFMATVGSQMTFFGCLAGCFKGIVSSTESDKKQNFDIGQFLANLAVSTELDDTIGRHRHTSSMSSTADDDSNHGGGSAPRRLTQGQDPPPSPAQQEARPSMKDNPGANNGMPVPDRDHNKALMNIDPKKASSGSRTSSHFFSMFNSHNSKEPPSRETSRPPSPYMDRGRESVPQNVIDSNKNVPGSSMRASNGGAHASPMRRATTQHNMPVAKEALNSSAKEYENAGDREAAMLAYYTSLYDNNRGLSDNGAAPAVRRSSTTGDMSSLFGRSELAPSPSRGRQGSAISLSDMQENSFRSNRQPGDTFYHDKHESVSFNFAPGMNPFNRAASAADIMAAGEDARQSTRMMGNMEDASRRLTESTYDDMPSYRPSNDFEADQRMSMPIRRRGSGLESFTEHDRPRSLSNNVARPSPGRTPSHDPPDNTDSQSGIFYGSARFDDARSDAGSVMSSRSMVVGRGGKPAMYDMNSSPDRNLRMDQDVLSDGVESTKGLPRLDEETKSQVHAMQTPRSSFRTEFSQNPRHSTGSLGPVNPDSPPHGMHQSSRPSSGSYSIDFPSGTQGPSPHHYPRTAHQNDGVRAPSPSSGSPHRQQAIALYNYSAADDNELDLIADETTITILQEHDSGWWKGRDNTTGRVGFYPSNYVQLLET